MQSEKKTEHYLVTEVKKRKGLCLKLLALYFIGLPDRLVLLPMGYILFIETKSQGDKPRKSQLHVHYKLRQLGFIVYVADTKEKINTILDEYDKWYTVFKSK